MHTDMDALKTDGAERKLGYICVISVISESFFVLSFVPYLWLQAFFINFLSAAASFYLIFLRFPFLTSAFLHENLTILHIFLQIPLITRILRTKYFNTRHHICVTIQRHKHLLTNITDKDRGSHLFHPKVDLNAPCATLGWKRDKGQPTLSHRKTHTDSS